MTCMRRHFQAWGSLTLTGDSYCCLWISVPFVYLHLFWWAPSHVMMLSWIWCCIPRILEGTGAMCNPFIVQLVGSCKCVLMCYLCNFCCVAGPLQTEKTHELGGLIYTLMFILIIGIRLRIVHATLGIQLYTSEAENNTNSNKGSITVRSCTKLLMQLS
jgi:hypothetical protein